MNLNKLAVSISVVAVLIAGIVFFNKPAQITVDKTQTLGGVAQDQYSEAFFHDTATVGGNILATSSIGAVTYTAASISKVSLIQHTAASALTATLPASSTLTNFIKYPGDTKTIYIHAITTGITLAGATGVDLDTASSTKNIVAGNVARLDFIRKSNSDIEVVMTQGSGN